MVPNAQINDSVLVTLGDQGGSDVGIDTLTLHDLFIWKKFLDILVIYIMHSDRCYMGFQLNWQKNILATRR